jgi:hypothetical protein
MDHSYEKRDARNGKSSNVKLFGSQRRGKTAYSPQFLELIKAAFDCCGKQGSNQ